MLSRAACRLALTLAGFLGSAGLAGAETITLLTNDNRLALIDSGAPDTALAVLAITGLGAGEVVEGIDYRPATGALYGVAAAGNVASLYRIDPSSGAATLVGAGPFTNGLVAASVAGYDFDPVADTLRIITNVGQNVTVDPDTAVFTTETATAWAPGDPGSGNDNDPNALAYSDNSQTATSTTAYAIVYSSIGAGVQLIHVGSVGGSPDPASSGLMYTVGGVGINNYAGFQTGLDIAPGGAVYALLNSPLRLYSLDLTDGSSAEIGSLPQGMVVEDLAVGGPAPSILAIPALSGLGAAALGLLLAAAALLTLRRA